MAKKVAIIGCGNLGSSIARGVKGAGLRDASEIILSDMDEAMLAVYAKEGFVTTTDNNEAADKADIIIFALKPWLLLPVMKEIDIGLLKDKIVASVAAGVSLEQIESVIGTATPLFRVMPNTAAAVGESITFIATNNGNEAQMNELETLLGGIGETVKIEEKQMDAATVLGASGIAFALRYIRASVAAGVDVGLKPELAQRIVSQMIKGGIALLEANNSHPETEIDKVTTPGGSTIAGLNGMEEKGFTAAVIHGVKSGVNRLKK